MAADGELVLALAADPVKLGQDLGALAEGDRVLGGMAGLTSRHPSVVETSSPSPAGNARAGLGTTHGALVIDSTTPARQSEASPTAIALLASITASSPDPHSRFTVTPGTPTGSPASSEAMRGRCGCPRRHRCRRP